MAGPHHRDAEDTENSGRAERLIRVIGDASALTADAVRDDTKSCCRGKIFVVLGEACQVRGRASPLRADALGARCFRGAFGGPSVGWQIYVDADE